MSGFVASTPGAFRVMCVRENSPMGLPISSSNVALQALATLEVPVTKQHTSEERERKQLTKYLSLSVCLCIHTDLRWHMGFCSKQTSAWACILRRGSTRVHSEVKNSRNLLGPRGKKHFPPMRSLHPSHKEHKCSLPGPQPRGTQMETALPMPTTADCVLSLSLSLNVNKVPAVPQEMSLKFQ